MIVIEGLSQVLAQLETERGVDKSVLLSAIEQALVSACRRKFPEDTHLDATINLATGEAHIFKVVTVVEEVENPVAEITLKDAKKKVSDATIGYEFREEVDFPEMGRLGAQTAKQVIIQRIREAEKNAIFDEFQDRIGTVMTGTVQRVENRNYLINLGRTEAILGYKDQIPGEHFKPKDLVRIYLVDIEKSSKGTFLHISRTHPGLLQCLFELEIPEIQDKVIEIKSVSREPGIRSKIAVKSNNPTVGAVGTCVGHMGGRIQSVIKELGYEKIDVLEWSDDPRQFIASAMKPAKVTQVIITDQTNRHAVVVVPNDQLSLAIGKQGVNVRLAVKLTNWKLDVMNEEEYGKKAHEIQPKDHLSIIDKIRMSKEAEEATQNTEKEILIPKLKSDEPDDDEEMIKVSDLAKVLNMKTQELIDEAKSFGVDIKSNRAKLTAEQVDAIKENIKS